MIKKNNVKSEENLKIISYRDHYISEMTKKTCKIMKIYENHLDPPV